MKFIVALFIAIIFVAGCSKNPKASMPNPASVNCIEKGGRLEIRKDAGGNEYGVCIFPNGKECEEWAFFRGECSS